MAVTLYCGNPGSGKSYEVVAFVILPALAKGRRVVTNVSGLDEALIRDHLVMVEKVSPDAIGEIHSVDEEEILAPGFFPKIGSDEPSVVRPGDLVVIDEAWNVWGADKSISTEHMTFFRKHRHMTHAETGVSCDLVVISQTSADIHRGLRGVVETSFEAFKLKLLFGTNSKTYKVRMFQGPNQRRKPVTTFQKRYDKRIFPLYKSYSGGLGAGVEVSVDDRQSILNRPYVWVMGVVVVGALVWGISQSLSFFSAPEKHAETAPPPEVPVSGVVPASFSERVGEFPPEKRSAASFQAVVKREVPPLSSSWRLAGYLRFGDRAKVLLIDGSGRIRYADPSGFSFEDGKPVAGVVDDERVTPWSGVPVSGGSGIPSPVRDIRPGVVAGG